MTDETPQNMEMQSTKPEKTDEIVYNDSTPKPDKKDEDQVIENRRTTLDTLEELEEKDGAIFSDSTHRYLVYYGTAKSNSGFCLALVVLITQISLYAILADEPQEAVEAAVVPVEIAYAECGNYLGRHYFARMFNNDTGNITANTIWVGGALIQGQPFLDLQCELNEWRVWTKDNAGVFILSLVLIWCFTAPDFLSAVSVIARVPSYWAKFVGFVLLFELFYAVHICNLNLFASIYNADKFGAILNTVGVLFIHDMDEAMFSALKIIDKKYVTFCKNSNNKFWKFVKENVQLLVMLAYGGLICIVYAISRSTINPE